MAWGKTFICDNCDYEIMGWDEGNPYYLDAAGKKHYAYHPDPMRDKCIGNDDTVLCLGCGHRFMEDLRRSDVACPECHGDDLANTYQLEGKTCPYCKSGVFKLDPSRFAIS